MNKKRDTLQSGYNFFNNRSNRVKSVEMKKNWHPIQVESREVKFYVTCCLIWQTDQVLTVKWPRHKMTFQKDGIF